MNDERLDRLLADFLDARQAEILAAARGPREAALRTRKVVAVQPRLGLRRASALTALLLILLLAMLLAAFAGADPFRRSDSLPGNGLITFGLHDLTQRPYTTIHVVAADGTEEHAVEPGYAQRYSAGGQILAYWAGPWPEEVLTIARPDGSSPQQVPGIAGGGDFSLSPDGTRIAWVKRVASREIAREDGGGERWPVSELWVMPLDGGQGTLVADTSVAPDGHLSTPAWSPPATRSRSPSTSSWMTGPARSDTARRSISCVRTARTCTA